MSQKYRTRRAGQDGRRKTRRSVYGVIALTVMGLLTASSGAESNGTVPSGAVPSETARPATRLARQVGRPMLLSQPASQTLLEEGREQLLGFRLAEAEATFRRLADQPDGGPAAYYHLSMLSMLQALIADEEVYFEAFHARSSTLEDLLEEAPASRWRTYLEAEMNLQRGLVAIKEERFTKAAWAARGAYKRFAQASEGDTGFYEPYKGLGLLHLSLASVPGAYRGLLRLLGYSGTVEGGVRELTLAAEKSRYNREEARIYLAIADVLFLDDREGGLERMTALHKARPQSPLFAHLYGFMLLSNRRAADAERVLRTVTENNDDPDVFPIVYADYFLATALFKQNAFAEAERYYRRYLQAFDGPSLRASARLGLGQALEMQDERTQAVAEYRQVEATRVSDTDEAAERQAHQLLKAPMTPRERKLLLGRNAFEAGKEEEAENIMASIYGNAGASDADRGVAAFYLGRIYHVQEQHSVALPYYLFAYQHPGPEGAGLRPWSLFHRAEIYALRGQTELAQRTYEAALDYGDGFDFHMALEQRTKIALERLTET